MNNAWPQWAIVAWLVLVFARNIWIAARKHDEDHYGATVANVTVSIAVSFFLAYIFYAGGVFKVWGISP